MLKIKIGDRHYHARGVTGVIATILFIPALLVMIAAIIVILILAIPSVAIGMIGARQVSKEEY